VSFFLKEFIEVARYMRDGQITGRFTFTKRGADYSCKLLEVQYPF
jgi:hypothetical protein